MRPPPEPERLPFKLEEDVSWEASYIGGVDGLLVVQFVLNSLSHTLLEEIEPLSVAAIIGSIGGAWGKKGDECVLESVFASHSGRRRFGTMLLVYLVDIRRHVCSVKTRPQVVHYTDRRQKRHRAHEHTNCRSHRCM